MGLSRFVSCNTPNKRSYETKTWSHINASIFSVLNFCSLVQKPCANTARMSVILCRSNIESDMWLPICASPEPTDNLQVHSQQYRSNSRYSCDGGDDIDMESWRHNRQDGPRHYVRSNSHTDWPRSASLHLYSRAHRYKYPELDFHSSTSECFVNTSDNNVRSSGNDSPM